jgi:hypothetical protein
MLDEGFAARGLPPPAQKDIEYIDDFPAVAPKKYANIAVSQLRKPGWAGIEDQFILRYGDRESHVVVYRKRDSPA